MKIQCDVCEKQEASMFCAADEAALCEGCDYRVHHANKLASKHLRFSLLHPSFKEAPLCDICQEKRAFLFCKEDRAILCRECDIPIHKANEHTQNHNRFLLTGVKVSATQPNNKFSPRSSSNNSSYDQNSISNTKSSSITMSSSDHDIFNQNSCYYSNNNMNNHNNNNNNTSTPSSTMMNYNQVHEEGSISTNNDFSDYLMGNLPGWRLEDMFDSSNASHNHCKNFDYTNMNEVNTNQQVDESMGRFGSENESMMWGFHNEGPLVPSHLPANFLQRF